jgi:lipopolysaccharide export system ATP-binding protein
MSEGQILASGNADDLYQNPLVREHYLGKGFAI